jgi:large subunit ribosomal protein L18
MIDKKVARHRRARRTRARIRAANSMRLTVYKTPQHIYAQIITADGSQVITSASTIEAEFKQNHDYGGNVKAAIIVGKMIAERAKSKGITKVAFDRSGFQYHGRIKALAEAVREEGLNC